MTSVYIAGTKSQFIVHRVKLLLSFADMAKRMRVRSNVKVAPLVRAGANQASHMHLTCISHASHMHLGECATPLRR